MSGWIVVVGDTLLDRDVSGAASRLCPDTPVPVLDEQSASERPGGAGLAALLAAQDGLEVSLVTALASDPGGARLRELLSAAGVAIYPLPLPGATPEKIRLTAGGQLLLRLDRGGAGTPTQEPGDAAVRALAEADAVLVSDYGRGVTRLAGLRAGIAATRAPVVWDPHPRGPAPVAGTRLATPNESELWRLSGSRAGVGVGESTGGSGGRRLAVLTRAGQQLRQRWRAGAVAVTLGAEGALLCHAGPAPLVVPVPVPGPATGDTCGAGDRFAVSAAAMLARGALVTEAVTAAVTRASRYVADGGAGAAARPGPVSDPHRPDRPGVPDLPGMDDPAGSRRAVGELVTRVRKRGGRVVATGGCFDLLHAGHLATLQAARRLGDCLVVCLNSDASVAALKGPGRPVVRQADRYRLLAGLECVDAVVLFNEPSPAAVLSWLRPDVWAKGGDYAGSTGEDGDLPEADQVRRWGGQTVLLPYLAGRSTTTLIAAARNGHREAPS